MRRAGFTIVELIIGMFITAMVLAALAAVSMAVSNGWQQADSADSSFVTGTQVQSRLAQYFRPAAAIGVVQKGSFNSTVSPATLFFWMGDTTDVTNPTGDGQIQFNEIGLLRYDTASDELRLYYASDWSTWSTGAKTAANLLASTAYINNTGNFTTFMATCPNYRVLMRNVHGVRLNTDTNDSPLVEYQIELEDSKGHTTLHYGTITLRAPVTATN